MRRDHEDAAATALSTRFHVIASSANAALCPRGFLDVVARSDRAGANRVLVFAPAHDVSYVKHKLAAMTRKNLVLAMPIDETSLRREILRAHPALAARLAVEEALEDNADPTKRLSPEFGRPAVLIVDDDLTTATPAASGAPDDADVTLVAMATRPTVGSGATERATARRGATPDARLHPADRPGIRARMRRSGGPLRHVLNAPRKPHRDWVFHARFKWSHGVC